MRNCYRVRWFITLLSEHKLKEITCSAITDDSNVAIVGHVLNERRTGTTYDGKGSRDRLKVLQKKTWRSAPNHLLSVPLLVNSDGRIHIWCIRVLGDSVIVKISCISDTVIVV